MTDLQPAGLFIELLAAELHTLKRTAQRISFPSGHVIFRQDEIGDGVYVVEEGRVEISAMVPQLDRRVLSRLGPGTFFGEMAVVDDQPRSATATAEVDTVVSFIPREEMLRVLEQSPQLMIALVRELTLRMRQFDRRFLEEILQTERLAVVGRFAQAIVHDFKNPLNMIAFAADVAAEEDAPPEHRAEARTVVRRQVTRLSNMINELLEFTRGSSGSVALVACDYGKFVQDLLGEIRPEAAERAVQIECENAPLGTTLLLDQTRLPHVFYNLVNNAADFLPQGGRITLRFQVRDREVVTEVEDSGPGIAPEIAARLFEPFATHGKTHGTGLGLSICKRIVEDHKGQIRARNEPGRGAIFSFTLPR
ncbi:MAG: hypothetical protein QOE70_156 [Chthoniobacter sp.]|jgi:signal transduction histidine kinase|nr:hypothetical protein [Chthoniobacter sp.]